MAPLCQTLAARGHGPRRVMRPGLTRIDPPCGRGLDVRQSDRDPSRRGRQVAEKPTVPLPGERRHRLRRGFRNLDRREVAGGIEPPHGEPGSMRRATSTSLSEVARSRAHAWGALVLMRTAGAGDFGHAPTSRATWWNVEGAKPGEGPGGGEARGYLPPPPARSTRTFSVLRRGPPDHSPLRGTPAAPDRLAAARASAGSRTPVSACGTPACATLTSRWGASVARLLAPWARGRAAAP